MKPTLCVSDFIWHKDMQWSFPSPVIEMQCSASHDTESGAISKGEKSDFLVLVSSYFEAIGAGETIKTAYTWQGSLGKGSEADRFQISGWSNNDFFGLTQILQVSLFLPYFNLYHIIS